MKDSDEREWLKNLLKSMQVEEYGQVPMSEVIAAIQAHYQPQAVGDESDWLEHELIGFANDLLAYDERMTKAGSNTLFIGDYVRKRKKRILARIANERQHPND